MMRAQQQVPADPFDPACGVFVAQDARPAGLVHIEPAALSACERALLLIDGTVTRFLEAYFLEPVRVIRLEQTTRILDHDDPWLEAQAGAAVVDRSVKLCGEHSGRVYACAQSDIAAGRLSPAMRAGLEARGGGLGRILVASGLETRREALWYGIEPDGRLHPAARLAPGRCLTRSYRVIASGRPLMVITERFPVHQTETG